MESLYTLNWDWTTGSVIERVFINFLCDTFRVQFVCWVCIHSTCNVICYQFFWLFFFPDLPSVFFLFFWGLVGLKIFWVVWIWDCFRTTSCLLNKATSLGSSHRGRLVYNIYDDPLFLMVRRWLGEPMFSKTVKLQFSLIQFLVVWVKRGELQFYIWKYVVCSVYLCEGA